MAKNATARLAKAKSRLKRLEEVIGPYVDKAVPQTPPPRGELRPGEYVHIRKTGEDARPRLRVGFEAN